MEAGVIVVLRDPRSEPVRLFGGALFWPWGDCISRNGCCPGARRRSRRAREEINGRRFAELLERRKMIWARPSWSWMFP